MKASEEGMFFLDSGAFSIKPHALKYAKEKKCSLWEYYETKAFWRFMDCYAEFVKKYQKYIDLYANMDAIGNPELTWRNQQYLEKEHGLKPVPVIHFRTDIKWVSHYIKHGYDLIGLGGIKGKDYDWFDRVFDLICDTPNRLPRVRVHGFGATGYKIILRYPWWSVDSATWTKVGAYGNILVPHKRGGKFVFNEQPYVIGVSLDSPTTKDQGMHLNTISKGERRIVEEWLELIGIPLGKMKGEEIEERGVCTHHTSRKIACLLFFEKMRESLPPYPWPFQSKRRVLGFAI